MRQTRSDRVRVPHVRQWHGSDKSRHRIIVKEGISRGDVPSTCTTNNRQTSSDRRQYEIPEGEKLVSYASRGPFK